MNSTHVYALPTQNRFSVLIGVLILIIATISCKSGGVEPESPTTAAQELNIPDGFNFETTQESSITVILPSSVDFTTLRSRVSIYTHSPDEGGLLLGSGVVQQDGRVTISVTIPTYLESVHVETISGSATLQLNSASLFDDEPNTIDFNEGLNFDPPNDEPQEGETSSLQSTFETWESVESARSFQPNIIQNPDFEEDDFGLIDDWSSPIPFDGRWHITSTLGTNNARKHSDNTGTMMRFTPSPSRYGGVTQILPASPGDLITLISAVRQSGSPFNISWLFIIARDSNGNPFSYYSVQTNGNTGGWINRGIATTMPPGTASVQILLWSHIFGGTIDFTNIYVTGPVTDSDGDGVPDEEDDYPDDPLRAVDIYYPAKDVFGTLAYEDLWPRFGDYDMNDLVLDFNIKMTGDASNRIKDIAFHMAIRATGAGFKNGFGISIPTPSSNVESVTGTRLTEGIIETLANGLEAGHTNQSVVIAFDNADLNIGRFANVHDNTPYVTPDTVLVSVTFLDPSPDDLLDTTAPFIFIDQDRGREVHLPGNQPTELANPDYFGRDDDDTQPNQGRYYLSNQNLNWAFAVPQSIPYPLENVEILDVYLRFAEWAESGGEAFPDWYLDKPGYRDESKLYQIPE